MDKHKTAVGSPLKSLLTAVHSGLNTRLQTVNNLGCLYLKVTKVLSPALRFVVASALNSGKPTEPIHRGCGELIAQFEGDKILEIASLL
jgi:hypothetical protein